MKEEIINFGDNRSIVGILTHGAAMWEDQYPCVVFINAGIIHKIGPNRLYVKIARELADKGITSFRFDYSGSGDSELINQSTNIEAKNVEILQALDSIHNETGINEFILVGICSGAEDAFKVSLIDKRIVGLSLANGVYQNDRLLKNIEPLASRNCAIRYYKKNAFSYKRWRKVLIGKSSVFTKRNIVFAFAMLTSIFSKLLARNRKNLNIESQNSESEVKFSIDGWKLLFDRNVKIQLIFTEGDTAIDVFNLTIRKQLNAYRNSPLLTFQLIKDIDHTFTPKWAQDFLSGVTVNWTTKFFRPEINKVVLNSV